MTPDPELGKGAKDEPATPPLAFARDAGMPALVAKIAAVVLVLAGLAAWLATALPPAARATLALAGALAGVIAVSQAAAAIGRGAAHYTLTPQRLELERGLLSKRHESVELWRVRDVVLDQSVLDRMRGAGTITIFSTDQVAPVLVIGPVAEARKRYEAIRDAAQAARRDGRVLNLDR